jgi:hypothetical protein
MIKQKETDGEEYRWYIQPGNDHTNEVLSRDLFDFGRRKARIKGKIEEIPVWEAAYAYVAYFQRSHRNNQRIEFKVYTQKKGNEKTLLYPWPYDAAHPRQMPNPKRKVT